MLVTAGLGRWVSHRVPLDLTISVPSNETDDVADPTHHFPARWLKRHSHEELEVSRTEASEWGSDVVEAMQHAWSGYKRAAWGYDSLHPREGKPSRWFNLGLSIVETMDTLWLLGLHDEFDEAQQWVEEKLIFQDADTKMDSFFEATIRLLGGLLGAHSLSQRPIFLQRAQELGDRLISAWPPGADLPNGQVNIGANTSSHLPWAGQTFSTAEVGSCQLEFRYLSHHTGDPTYAIFADRAFRAVLAASGSHGLISADLQGNKRPVQQGSKITLGAHGDSYYEYLLKQYLQTSQSEPHFLERWKSAMKEMMDRLVHRSTEGLLYVAKETNGKIIHEFDHLTCFVAGMLILALFELPSGEVPESYFAVAEGITTTCRSMYDTYSGLPPEIIDFSSGSKKIKSTDAFSLLRPEAVEAMYYMWYYTGDHIYRQWANDVLVGLNKSARTLHGFSSLKDVDAETVQMTDTCESFFFAETLKYLYLIQSDPELLPLDEFVFNTEAHPLRIWQPGEAPQMNTML